jgi:DNA-binding winged helix-turn-helix (wHTH) protein
VATAARPNVLRFGSFEFNRDSRELRKGGMHVRLEGQPLSILQMLLDRPGELVTREELQENLWAGDTFVDFEHSLNAAVKRLRATLSDSAEQPRYIETLARRGYRFIAPVSGIIADRETDAASLASGDHVRKLSRSYRGYLWLVAATGVCVVAVAGWGWRQWRRRPVAPPVPVIRSLAVLPLENLSGDPSQEYIADGITEELIGRLSNIHGLRVISRTSAMHFKNTHLSSPEIVKTLGVR